MKKPAQDIVMQEFKVTESAQLLSFLLEKQVRKSRNAVKSLLAHKQIKVNKKMVTQFDFELNPKDVVSVMKYNQARKRNKLKGVTIVYEDEYLVVIEKESGLLSVGTEKEKTSTAFNVVNQYIKKTGKRDDRIYVLHRLDREVSGLMVFSKDIETQAIFQNNWDQVVKLYSYVAIVEGQLEPQEGTIKSWLTENKNFLVFSNANNNGGLEAITHYRTEKTSTYYSQVFFRLETRRKNQLRAQMKQMGHPVVGDRKYDAKNSPIKRMALHVQDLIIVHPVSGQMLEFKSILPAAMQKLMNM